MHSAILEAQNLDVGYQGIPILKQLNFKVNSGEVFVILGGSGCGKSTLLRTLIGLIPSLNGEILIHGHKLSENEGPKRQRLLNRIGVMFQSGALFGSMSLLENVSLPLEEFSDLPGEARKELAMLRLRLVGLADFADYLPAEISGGMQKRAAIARAMALDPGLIFLDEPSAGLDPVSSAELDELILNLARQLGLSFIVVSHELASIMSIADRAIMLDKTRQGIIAEGAPSYLANSHSDPAVQSFFHRRARVSSV